MFCRPLCSPNAGRRSTGVVVSRLVSSPLPPTHPPAPHTLTAAPTNGATVVAMRHRCRVARLGRPADQRKALVRSLVTEVLRHGRITTTKTKAKAIRKYVDKIIGLAKDGSLHARRQAAAFIYDEDIVASLFAEAPSRYADRGCGYCRVVTEPRLRRGDAAEMAAIELV